MKEIYDSVYNNIPNYDSIYHWKIDIINDIFKNYNKSIKIIDVGCGKGHYLRNFLNTGFIDIIGIELSTVCSEKFLQDVPHVNDNFLNFSESVNSKEYDVCLCMDVLEHIPSNDLDKFLNSINRISNGVVLGIANHSDMFLGEELHLIQEKSEWWYNKLQSLYSSVEKVYELSNKKFFIFWCKD